MNKTLRMTVALKNTYRVNGILFSIRQVPLVKKLVPETVYRVGGLKVFANIVSVLWEILSTFLGKFLYLMVIGGIAGLYEKVPKNQAFLHILVFLTIIGAFTNTFIFNPTKDKYYAIILMRMDSREHALVNYAYALIKLMVGFLPFSIIFGRGADLSLGVCLMIPLFVAGLKLVMAAYMLDHYEKTGKAPNENMLGRFEWITLFVLLAAAFGLPAIGVSLPVMVSMVFMTASLIFGILSVRKILKFRQYQTVYKEILTRSLYQMDEIKQAGLKANREAISADVSIISRKQGFEYLNELFIKRHHKILWKSSKRMGMTCLCLTLGLYLLMYLVPDSKAIVNTLTLGFLPMFPFVMYFLNRGTGFTMALFMNCDHSLLTYSFYKQPKFILKLFQIRLREIVKINLLPGAIIGSGLAGALWISGGTENPLNYMILFVSIVAMSIFFSVHYLMAYYLLQPYNSGTEMKSGTYRIMMALTYVVCWGMTQISVPTFIFGLLMIIFCVIYCIVACILVYQFAPKTFRIRN